MSESLRVSRVLIEQAMRCATTRAALLTRANKVASHVDSIGAAEGVKMNAKVSSGTRPKGRPYSRVESDQVAQEFGTSTVERRRIMGRAAEAGR